ncbi:MAG: hypothetical protein FJ144_19935 [Deltaproteobacteria bacterium]|nr:hypothetical protein [Deltaproteobacteria bacterium]
MRSSARTIAISALAAASLVSFVLLPSVARAADCWGAAADRVSIGPDGARVSARVTVPGASHESLVASGLSVSVVDAEDSDVVYFDETIAAADFTSRRNATRYDGTGSFDGSAKLSDERGHDDTVLIELRVRDGFDLGAASPAGVRVHVESGAGCARSCVSSCQARRPGGRLLCRKSALYEPFADEGFGAIDGATVRARRSAASRSRRRDRGAIS